MIVQINKSRDGEASVCMIAEDAGEQRDLQLLVDALQKKPFLERNSHVSVGTGADNVLLVTCKGGAPGRS